jgi:hypothetical protein
MNADARTQTAGRHIRRLMALLWALADLAERAAGRPAPIRHLVLWVLARGEAAASDHVFALTGRPTPEPSSIAPTRRDAAAALRLAARFRALAAALAAFAENLATTRRTDLCHAMAAFTATCHALTAPACPSAAIERLDSS